MIYKYSYFITENLLFKFVYNLNYYKRNRYIQHYKSGDFYNFDLR